MVSWKRGGGGAAGEAAADGGGGGGGKYGVAQHFFSKKFVRWATKNTRQKVCRMLREIAHDRLLFAGRSMPCTVCCVWTNPFAVCPWYTANNWNPVVYMDFGDCDFFSKIVIVTLLLLKIFACNISFSCYILTLFVVLFSHQ